MKAKMLKLKASLITAFAGLAFTHPLRYGVAEAANIESNCEPVENVGLNSLERFNYSVSMDITDDCMYSLVMKFKHDDALPVPNDPSAQCDPSIVPPIIASDGLPYFAFRWAYESLPDYIKQATGVDHITIDFNPCGHPPVDIFTIPHFDIHVYLVDPEYRSCLTCEKIPGAPICDPFGQTTTNGKGKFSIRSASAKTVCMPYRVLVCYGSITNYDFFDVYQVSSMLLNQLSLERLPTCHLDLKFPSETWFH